MTYRYKRDTSQQILEHKARCTVRGYKMIPDLHCNPNHTTSHNAEKTTIRLLLAYAAASNLVLDQFDIVSAYTHEPYSHDKPVYIKQPKQFDGTLRHPDKNGILRKNLYGTPSGGYYYLDGAITYLRTIGFK